MIIHVYRVVEEFVVDVESDEARSAMEMALAEVQASEKERRVRPVPGRIPGREPTCSFVAVVPGEQEQYST